MAYQLDLKYHDELFNANQCDLIIKCEILYLTSEDKKNKVLIEYSNYVRKFEGFSDDHL